MKKTVLETTEFPNVYNTWVFVAYRHELKKNKPIRKTIMGMNVVVAEDSTGKISVLDGYCPHMGAPLDEGRIVDDCIVCPFHSYRFNVDGERVNNKGEVMRKQTTRVHKYPVDVQGEYIFAWFDEDFQNPRPLNKIPDITYSELHRMPVRPYAFFDVMMKCCAQIPFENTADASHFESVHHNIKAEPQKPEDYGFSREDKIWFSNMSISGYTFFDSAGIDFDFPHNVRMFGPNNVIDDIPFSYSANTRLAKFLPASIRRLAVKLPLRVTLLAVPVDEENTLFRIAINMKDHKASRFPLLALMLKKFIGSMAGPLARWEFKNEGDKIFGPKISMKYIDHLSKADRGPMEAYREYCAMFYHRADKEAYDREIEAIRAEGRLTEAA